MKIGSHEMLDASVAIEIEIVVAVGDTFWKYRYLYKKFEFE